MGRRSRIAVALALVALTVVGVGSFASAGSFPKPKTGAWKFIDAKGGFTLKAGKGGKRGQLYISNVHSRTNPSQLGCPDRSKPITVSGRFHMTLHRYAGYNFWAVGKTGIETRYSDSTRLKSVKATVKVGGKKVPGGGFKMEYSALDPTKFLTLIIEFGPKGETPCLTYSQDAKHK